MFELMISFPSDISVLHEFGISDVRAKESLLSGHKSYLLSDAEEVTKVILALSHLSPIITLRSVDCVTADVVLKDFEPKEI